jgi:hypothetical protein
MFHTHRILLGVLLLVVAPLPVRGADPEPAEESSLASQEDKERARAEFEASRTGVRDLARGRLDAARTWMWTRYQQYLAGRGTLSILEEAAAAVRDAELALATGPADRLAARERYRIVTQQMDLIVTAQHQAGRASLADWAMSHLMHLEAEARLAEALRDLGRPSLPQGNLFFPGMEDGTEDPVWTPTMIPQAARALFEAVHGDPGQRARDRVETALIGYEDRWRQYRMGRCTLDIMSGAALHLQEARLAALTPDRRAALYARWEQAQAAEEIVEAQYEAGRAGAGDYAQARFNRLDAAVALAKAGGERRQPFSSPPYMPIRSGADHDSKRQAQAEFEDATRMVSDLEQARLEAAREHSEWRYRYYLSGRGTLDMLLESLGQELAARLALADRPAGRIEILDRHRSRARQIEQILQAQYEAGRASLADFAQARHARLDAEIRLARARESNAKEK